MTLGVTLCRYLPYSVTFYFMTLCNISWTYDSLVTGMRFAYVFRRNPINQLEQVMKSTKASARVLVLRGDKDGSYGRYAHITGHASHVSTKESCGYDGERYGSDSEILNLRLRSQCSDKSTEFYGMEIAYEAHREVTSCEARKAIKMLDPIERKLSKMYAEEGAETNIGQWVNRVARAIGAVSVIIFDAERKAKCGYGYRCYTLGESVFAVNSMSADLIAWANENSLKLAA